MWHLGGDTNALMEAIVDERNIETAWARVKANRGAPGPDGITVKDFPEAIIRDGRRWCVDIDLSKFFDRVQYDVLMCRVARKVRDKRLLKLIGRYLRAGMMVDGLHQPSEEVAAQHVYASTRAILDDETEADRQSR
jgi:retron-type reverse transcriptase